MSTPKERRRRATSRPDARAAQVASFPLGLVPPRSLGVAITSVAMPEVKRRHPVTAPPPPQASPQAAEPAKRSRGKRKPAPTAMPDPGPAIPLPQHAEPLVTAADAGITVAQEARTYFTMSQPALPRNRSLTRPQAGLVAAIGAWLGSMGRMIAAGFLVKKTHKRPAATPIPDAPRRGLIASLTGPQADPASLRERTELTQLRAENRRLRRQLDSMEARRAPTGETTPAE